MNRIIANAIVELVNESGGEATLYEEYSGRSMYGKTTCGVIVNDIGHLMGLLVSDAMDGERGLIFQTVSEEDTAVPMPGSFNYDQMGLDIIVY